jgi:hypothetical protein
VAKIMKKNHSVEISLEPPPLNLLSGKFRRHGASAEDAYDGRYRIEMRLIEDESPIKRIELKLINLRTNTSAGRYVMPVLFWKFLEDRLPPFLEDVVAELARRGEPPARFKRRAPSGKA